VPGPIIRIFSDVHYGDHASNVKRLAQLRPLLDDEIDRLVLNGDTIDTRPGPRPDYTAELAAETTAFFSTTGIPATLLTGNHDPYFTPHHYLDLAEGRVLATHGDVLFDDIVPWGKDVALTKRLMTAELERFTSTVFDRLDDHLALCRRVCAQIPQRHQVEKNPIKYWLHFASDTVWPPTRVLRVLGAWRRAPGLAAAFLRRHRPQARFVLNGHTHRPGIWRMPDGIVAINTGSFCPGPGGLVVDLLNDRLTVRRLERRNGEFYAAAVVAEFSLADTPASPRLSQ
jgi:UDP-2,3-diacylglucosamine pyrophosphatase LpxH